MPYDQVRPEQIKWTNHWQAMEHEKQVILPETNWRGPPRRKQRCREEKKQEENR